VVRSRGMSRTRRQAACLLCASFVLVGGVWRGSTVTTAVNAAQGDAGDVKISAYPYPAQGNEGNEPHVPCQFYLLGFNMAAPAGTATVDGWPPTGDGSQVLTFTYATQPDGTFVSGPYGLPTGHYKINVTDNKEDDILKHKVFWVDTCTSPSATPSASPTSPATDTPTPPTVTPTNTVPSDTSTPIAKPTGGVG